MGWLQRQDTPFEPIWGRLIPIFCFRNRCWISSSQLDSLWRPSCLEGDTRSRSPWRPFWVSASALCSYYWPYQNIRHRRGQLVHPGSNVAEPPAMLALHYIGLAFLRHSPTVWSINAINFVAWECRPCRWTGAFIGGCRSGGGARHGTCLSHSVYS